MAPRVCVITLGCAKNRVDSEHLLHLLQAGGWEVVPESQALEAPLEALVINTCGFIQDAKTESIDVLFEALDAKERGHTKKVYVFGCLSGRYAKELPPEFPEVDGFFGADHVVPLARAMGVAESAWTPSSDAAGAARPTGAASASGEMDAAGAVGAAGAADVPGAASAANVPGTARPTGAAGAASASEFPLTRRVLTTPPHYAYLKLSEGCDRTCAYCAIPLIRGPHRSAPKAQLIEEARNLAQMGVKELILVAQDTSYYGLDRSGERELAPLMESLCGISGIEWIRLLYTYPQGFPLNVLELMAQEPKICQYVDIPLQHVSDAVLKAMRRHTTGAQTRQLIEAFRTKVPGICLRTTLMVGHPGEGRKEFEELMDFVSWARFERLGAFMYSQEEGTYGALHLRDSVTQATKQRRYHKLMTRQQEISLAYNQSLVGQRLRVLVDRVDRNEAIARGQAMAPEVDGNVRIALTPQAQAQVGAASPWWAANNVPPVQPGQFIEVEVTGADPYDLFAKLTKNT